MLNTYLLRPMGYESNDDISPSIEDSPWDPWYDKCFGFVIRAMTDFDARHIADANAGHENDFWSIHPWLDENMSTCIKIDDTMGAGLIIKDVQKA